MNIDEEHNKQLAWNISIRVKDSSMNNVTVLAYLKSLSITLYHAFYNIGYYMIRPEEFYNYLKEEYFPEKKTAYGQWHSMNIQGNLQGIESKIIKLDRNQIKVDLILDSIKSTRHMKNNNNNTSIPMEIQINCVETDWINTWHNMDPDKDYITDLMTRKLLGKEDEEVEEKSKLI